MDHCFLKSSILNLSDKVLARPCCSQISNLLSASKIKMLSPHRDKKLAHFITATFLQHSISLAIGSHYNSKCTSNSFKSTLPKRWTLEKSRSHSEKPARHFVCTLRLIINQFSYKTNKVYLAVFRGEGGGLLSYISYTGMCRWKEHGFQAIGLE